MALTQYVPPWYVYLPKGFVPYYDPAVFPVQWSASNTVNGPFNTLAELLAAWTEQNMPASGIVPPALVYTDSTTGHIPESAMPGTPSYVKGNQHLFVTGKSGYNWKPSNTRRYQAGLGKAAAGASATELWIGDSICGGCTGLGPPVTFDRPNAICRQYERAMASHGVPYNGTGFIKVIDGTRTDARVATSGAWVTSNMTGAQSAASGNTITVTSNVTANTAAVIYYDYLSATPFTVSVNGANSGTGYATVSTVNSNTWKRQVLTGVTVTNGSTLVITAGAANVVIHAVEFYGSSGVTVQNLGLSGSSLTGIGTDGWISTSDGWDPLNIYGRDAAQVFRETPCVVHALFGYYDIVNNSNVLPANYSTQLQVLRAQWPNSDFILHATPMPLSVIGAGSAAQTTWTQYLQLCYSMADTMDVPLVDIHNLLGGGTQEQTLGLNSDTSVHLTTAAYNIWGRATAALAMSA